MLAAFRTQRIPWNPIYFTVLALGLSAGAEASDNFEKECRAISPEHEWVIDPKTDQENKIRACMLGETHDGPYMVDWPDGRPKVRGMYRNGEMEGVWTRWHSNGMKWDRGRWKEGSPDGEWRIWFENGKLKAKGFFSDGKRVCLWREWSEAGVLTETEMPPPQDGCPGDFTRARIKKTKARISLGLHQIDYEEGPFIGFDHRALVPDLTYRVDLPAGWDLHLNGRISAVVLGEPNVRFYGLRAYAGRELSLTKRLGISLGAGGGYLGMMVPNQDFGFSKLLHPVLVPEVSWNLTDRQNLSFSLRYAPLTEETFGMSFDGNREFAFRLGWSFALHDGNRFRVDLEITHLVMDLDPVYQVRRHTNGVSIGYEF